MFRIVVAAALGMLVHNASAQNPAGMSDADMEKMMQGMQEMQSCMENIDQAAMERMGKEAEALNEEVKTLCAAGKRDEAQSRAMAYGMKMAKDPHMKAMAECGKKMQGVMPQMQNVPGAPTEEELKNRHVCDQP